jgi:hypothetical protein
MRTQAIYETECLCGTILRSPLDRFRCPTCLRLIELHWGGHETPAKIAHIKEAAVGPVTN